MDLYDFENEHILNITIIRGQVKELSGFSHAFPYHRLIFFFPRLAWHIWECLCTNIFQQAQINILFHIMS